MKRSSGILLPVFSLPSPYGIGCFSREAYEFIDWLSDAGQTYWQILPLSSTSYGGSADSPYQSFSAFAGNPYFIDLHALVEEGTLLQSECELTDFGNDPQKIDYAKLHINRRKLLRKAYERSDISKNPDYRKFLEENNWWLSDFSLFLAVRNFFGEQPWYQWPQDIRLHWGFALDYYRRELYFDIEFEQYLQFHFFKQWKKLKNYANSRGIQIIGDVPIYVSADSADVWAHSELFQLDEDKRLTAVSGCPPDGFSENGQLWHNPLYRWDYHRQTGFDWWISRLWHSFQLYDVVRLDHFRGFDEYYSIPADSPTAQNGHWEPGPGMELFREMERRLGKKNIIAEDLGHLTESVRQLVRESGFPNMKVLEFAFEPEDKLGSNEYLPHNYSPNCVVYTGTHDNETIAGWFQGLKKETRLQIRNYLGDFSTPGEMMYKKMVQLAMMSCAKACILPIQDYLGLDNRSRVNQPGTINNNWVWRLQPDSLSCELQNEILALTCRYGRTR